MEAIILAGGFGTRLRSRLTDLPKAMAPIAGRPFLEFLLDRLVAAGASRVILSVGHLRQIILDRIPLDYRGIQIKFAIEQSPLGTGGAIRHAMREVQEPSVLVMNGDTYVDVDLAGMVKKHRIERSIMTIAVTYVDDAARYGGVIIQDGKVIGFAEKGKFGPSWINAGTYVLSSDFPWPASLPTRFSFEEDVMVPLVAEIRPAAFPYAGCFLDIGVPEDLDRAETALPQLR